MGQLALLPEARLCGLLMYGQTCTQLFVIITTGKISTNKNPDVFTRMSVELELVLCCRLVDSGGGKSVLLQNSIYIYIYIYIYICHNND